MRLSEMIAPEAVATELRGSTGEEAISELCDLLCLAIGCEEKEKMFKLLMEREELGSTAIGHGVALPHARVVNLDGFHVALGLSKKGVDFHASDRSFSHIVFLLVGPKDASGFYLKALARIARLARDEALRNRLLKCKSAEAVVAAIQEAEAKYLS